MSSIINLKRVSRDTYLYIPVFLAPAFINIILLMMFTRFFSPKEYGKYTIVVNTTIIISSFLAQWIVLSVQRYRPEYANNGTIPLFNRYLNKLLLYISIGFILLTSILFFFFPTSLTGYQSYYWPSVLFIISSIYFMVLGGVYQVDLQTKQYRNYNVLQSILKLAIIFILIKSISFNPTGFVWGAFLAQLLITLPMLSYVETFKIFKGTILVEHSFLEFVQKLWKYGFPLIGWYIGTTILNLTDRYMLEYYRSSAEVGVYSANFTIAVQAIALICNPLFFAIQPMMMNEIQQQSDKKYIERRIEGFTGIFLMIAMPFAVYFSIFRTEVSRLLLGEQFTSGAAIIPILIIGFFAWNIGLYGQLTYQIAERTKEMFYFVVVAAVSNFLLNLYFIPKFGVTGASISTCIGFIVYSALLFIFSKKHIAWKIPWFSFLKIFTAAIILVLPILIIKVLFLKSVVPIVSLLIGSLFFVFYFGWVFIFQRNSIKQIFS